MFSKYHEEEFYGIVIKLPFYIVKSNKKLLNKLEELKEVLKNANGSAHPDIQKSIYEIKNAYEKEQDRLETEKRFKEAKEKIKVRNKKLINKDIIETEWVLMNPIWVYLPERAIVINDKYYDDFVCSKRGNVLKKYKDIFENEFNKDKIKFIETNFYHFETEYIEKGIIKDFYLVYSEYSVGLRYKQKFVKDYKRNRNGDMVYYYKIINVKDGKIIYPFDIIKYKQDGENFTKK